MTKTLGLLVFAGALSASAYSCPFCYDPKVLHIGETKVLGNGTVYSWVKLDDKGNPTGVGMTATATALEGLPTERPLSGAIGYEIPLKLPAQASATPFNHIAFDWNPLGHIPPGIYDVPHFDAHFYLMTTDERLKITMEGEDVARVKKPTPAGVMPSGYIMAPGSEEIAWMASDQPSVESVLVHRDELRTLAAALVELPERTRLAFNMHRLEGRPLREVAERLDISITRAQQLVKAAMVHGAKRLRERSR